MFRKQLIFWGLGKQGVGGKVCCQTPTYELWHVHSHTHIHTYKYTHICIQTHICTPNSNNNNKITNAILNFILKVWLWIRIYVLKHIMHEIKIRGRWRNDGGRPWLMLLKESDRVEIHFSQGRLTSRYGQGLRIITWQVPRVPEELQTGTNCCCWAQGSVPWLRGMTVT